MKTLLTVLVLVMGSIAWAQPIPAQTFELSCPAGYSPMREFGRTYNSKTKKWRANFCISDKGDGRVICQADGCAGEPPMPAASGIVTCTGTPCTAWGLSLPLPDANAAHYLSGLGTWTTPSAGMVWPATPGIAKCTGTPCTAWDTSIAAPDTNGAHFLSGLGTWITPTLFGSVKIPTGNYFNLIPADDSFGGKTFVIDAPSGLVTIGAHMQATPHPSLSIQADNGPFGSTPDVSLFVDGTTGLEIESNQFRLTHGVVQIDDGTNILYRCSVAGTLIVGQLTVVSGDCGAAVDTGLRIK